MLPRSRRLSTEVSTCVFSLSELKNVEGGELILPVHSTISLSQCQPYYVFNLGASQAVSAGGTRCRLSSEGDYIPGTAKKRSYLLSDVANKVNLDDVFRRS